VEGDGLFIEAGAAPLFDGYLDIEGEERVRKVSGFRYAERALPSGYRPPYSTSPPWTASSTRQAGMS